jgi:hypothetical protein
VADCGEDGIGGLAGGSLEIAAAEMALGVVSRIFRTFRIGGFF